MNSFRNGCQPNRLIEAALAQKSLAQCPLTPGEDKLPAIPRVAQTYAAMSGFHYTIGLWREILEVGLLWYMKDSKTSGRSREDRAPS
jgi:hypothetical protein